MRTPYTPILLLAVLGLAGCPPGVQGPTGPQGPAGATGATGPAGASAAIRTTAIAAGTTCAAGGERVEGGRDTNGNGVLDDSEVTTSANVCNGDAGAQGPAGPASAWQLVAADGFVFGQVTGFDGWLWNASLGGFLPKPVAQGTDLVLEPPASIHRIYYDRGACTGIPYIQVTSLGPEVLPHDVRIPEPGTAARINIDQVDWKHAPATIDVFSYVDAPGGSCTGGGGQTAGLVPLSPVGPVGNYTTVARVHPGPANLQPVTVP